MRRNLLSPFRRPSWPVGVAAVALVFTTVWAHSRVDRFQMELSEAAEIGRTLESRLELLSVDVDRSAGLTEVEACATRDLGLTTPEPAQITLLRMPAPRDGQRYALVEEAFAGTPVREGSAR